MGKRAVRDWNITSNGMEAGRIELTFGKETEQSSSSYSCPPHPLLAGNLPVAPAARSCGSQTVGLLSAQPGADLRCPGVNTQGDAFNQNQWEVAEKYASILVPRDRTTLSGVSPHFPEVPSKTEAQLLGMAPAHISASQLDPQPFSESASWGTQPETASFVRADQTGYLSQILCYSLCWALD